MNKVTLLSLGFAALVSLRASAAAVVIDGTAPETGGSVTIEHNKPPQWTEYQLVDGSDEIFGTPEYDRRKAMESWKTACAEWKSSMKELNGDRQLLTLNCASPVASKEGELTTYKSSGSYKMRIRSKERK